MFPNLSWLSRSRRLLAEQLQRLRQTLLALGQCLRERIADAVGGTVSVVVRDLVRPLLGGEEVPSLSTNRTPKRSWTDDPDEWFSDEELSTVSLPQEMPVSPSPPRRALLVTLVRGLVWGLGRHLV